MLPRPGLGIQEPEGLQEPGEEGLQEPFWPLRKFRYGSMPRGLSEMLTAAHVGLRHHAARPIAVFIMALPSELCPCLSSSWGEARDIMSSTEQLSEATRANLRLRMEWGRRQSQHCKVQQQLDPELPLALSYGMSVPNLRGSIATTNFTLLNYKICYI